MATHKKIKLSVLLIFSLIISSFIVYDDVQIEKIVKQLELFRTKYPQQKVHLHTDKEIYIAPENIWIKSYLLSASSFTADSLSKEVYVDLIDFNNNPIRTIIIRNRFGYGQGNITISDTLIEGTYRLRGYTNWMRNFDEAFFFTKTITIKNPNYENIVTTKRLKEIKRLNQKRENILDKISMNFFPEGGYLVDGFECKVAFKVENGVGLGIPVTGTVYADKVKVSEFTTLHKGMGWFTLKTETGKKYSCEIKYGNNRKKTFLLPPSLQKGVVMNVDPSLNDRIKITIQSSRDYSLNIASNEIKIIGQSRNNILYVSKGEVKDKPVQVEIPKSLFPAGITQFTLFDARNEPVCERLVFINPSLETYKSKIDISETTQKDSTYLKISLLTTNGKPANSNLSLSITELAGTENNRINENILTNLLLTSDIKGNIENPWYYFSGSPNAEKDIDLVMLTHGWRRFVWKDILSGKYPEITSEPSLGVSIGGKITRDFFEIPVPDAKVRLTIKSYYNDVFETKADKKGRFMFPNLDYEDTIDILIEAFKPSGGKGVQIILGDTVVPKVVTYIPPYPLNETFNPENIKANNQQSRLEFKKNYKVREPDNQTFKIHQTPQDVIYVGDDAVNYSNILQYMQGRIPGVNITGNKVIIRGINTFYGSTDPLFLLDGVPIDANSVTMINPMDIAIIEVLKGPEASIYGSRGANGVIAFYTRRGSFMKRGQIDFGMLGYHKVREFYNPPYDSWKYKPLDYKVPRTIIWKPELKTDSKGTVYIRYKNIYGDIPKLITIEGISDTGELIWYQK